jgi:hypothetical protein
MVYLLKMGGSFHDTKGELTISDSPVPPLRHDTGPNRRADGCPSAGPLPRSAPHTPPESPWFKQVGPLEVGKMLANDGKTLGTAIFIK